MKKKTIDDLCYTILCHQVLKICISRGNVCTLEAVGFSFKDNVHYMTVIPTDFKLVLRVCEDGLQFHV